MSEGNGFATRDSFLGLAAKPREFVEVLVEGLGKVRIRSLRESERSAIEAPNFTSSGKINLEKARDTKLRTIIQAVVNGDGEPFMGNTDIAELRKIDTRIVSQLYDAIAEHCGLDKDTLGAAEKNSEATTGASSQ